MYCKYQISSANCVSCIFVNPAPPPNTDKKENQIFLIYSVRKFRVEQLQSQMYIWGMASLYMRKYEEAVIVIYDFATAPF
jgi:hypothetical protein